MNRQVPRHSRPDYRNPCRYMHQHNNGWLFPFYGGDSMPMWEPIDALDDGPGVFDLNELHRSRADGRGYGFVIHETFHVRHSQASSQRPPACLCAEGC